METSSERTLNLMNLPIEMVDKIVSYLPYDQIAKIRGVNKIFNNICSDKLNKGFSSLEQFHNKCLKSVKTKLPRRESERKHHPLSRHCDILVAVETRLSMLSMTFSKYIESRHCCFIPGKVLDEGFRVLRSVKNSIPSSPNTHYQPLPRPHEFLQEYRDVSSMAMEHFDDKILPNIKEKIKIDNPRLYCYKNRPNFRPYLISTQTIRGLVPQPNLPPAVSSSSQLVPINSESYSGGSSRNNSVESVSIPATLLYKVVSHTKTKYNTTRKAVATLHQNIKAVSKNVKIQNIFMKRRLNQQKAVIKHLRRELRDTRIALNIVSKDVNQLKIEQSSTRDHHTSERPTTNSNLSLTAVASFSVPAFEEQLLESKGVKRKHEDCHGFPTKR